MTSARATVVPGALVLVLAACAVIPSQPTTDLAAAQRRPASTAEMRALPAEWTPFHSFTIAYEVKNDGGKTVLVVLAVSASRLYENRPSGTETVPMPKPVILASSGDAVGRLPLSYPDDPPFELQVRFGAWLNGWPRRIDMFVKDPTVSGDHALDPMAWDEASRRYVSGNKQ